MIRKIRPENDIGEDRYDHYDQACKLLNFRPHGKKATRLVIQIRNEMDTLLFLGPHMGQSEKVRFEVHEVLHWCNSKSRKAFNLSRKNGGHLPKSKLHRKLSHLQTQ